MDIFLFLLGWIIGLLTGLTERLSDKIKKKGMDIEEIVVAIQFENDKFLGVFGETNDIKQAITADSEDTILMMIKNRNFEQNFKFIKVRKTYQIIK
ncbi:hypothetical protein [Bacillus thuringiensis]|uniref:hypothetical protein n=1 Tax=Bacillus thuringiensis TaxID=1428 RepID=UPI000BFD63A2|nr:hypothetical protein [Bacillus thuringiensis]PGM07227.1 hypothetical protein CN938_22200 [Bacillus thuringiensis]